MNTKVESSFNNGIYFETNTYKTQSMIELIKSINSLNKITINNFKIMNDNISYIYIERYGLNHIVKQKQIDDFIIELIEPMIDIKNQNINVNDIPNNLKSNCCYLEYIKNQKDLRLYMDIEKIPYDKPELIKSIITDFINFYDINKIFNKTIYNNTDEINRYNNFQYNCFITLNKHSKHPGLSYHVFFPITINYETLKFMLISFLYYYPQYIPYIDLSVYKSLQLFRCIGQPDPSKSNENNSNLQSIHTPLYYIDLLNKDKINFNNFNNFNILNKEDFKYITTNCIIQYQAPYYLNVSDDFKNKMNNILCNTNFSYKINKIKKQNDYTVPHFVRKIKDYNLKKLTIENLFDKNYIIPEKYYKIILHSKFYDNNELINLSKLRTIMYIKSYSIIDELIDNFNEYHTFHSNIITSNLLDNIIKKNINFVIPDNDKNIINLKLNIDKKNKIIIFDIEYYFNNTNVKCNYTKLGFDIEKYFNKVILSTNEDLPDDDKPIIPKKEIIDNKPLINNNFKPKYINKFNYSKPKINNNTNYMPYLIIIISIFINICFMFYMFNSKK